MRIDGFYSVDEGTTVDASSARATEYVVLYESPKPISSQTNLTRSWLIIYL